MVHWRHSYQELNQKLLVGQYRRILVRQLSALSQMTWHALCLIILHFPFFYDAYRISV